MPIIPEKNNNYVMNMKEPTFFFIIMQASRYCKPTNYFARFKLAGFAVSVPPRKFIAPKMSDVMKTRKFLAPE